MMAENFMYIIFIVGVVIGAALIYIGDVLEVQPEVIDYSNRFDRLEARIQNSSSDVCTLLGGRWLTNGNNFIFREVDQNNEAAFCIKPKEVTRQ